MYQNIKLLLLCIILGSSSNLINAQEEDSSAPLEIELHFWLQDNDESILSARFTSSSPLQTVHRFIEEEKHKNVSVFPLVMLLEPDKIRFTIPGSHDAIPRTKRLYEIALGRKKLNLHMISEQQK